MLVFMTLKIPFLKPLLEGQVLPIENNTCKTIFKDVPSGEYAISIYHDINSNAKLDTNFLGIPKEDYTCSNGAMGFMGPQNGMMQSSYWKIGRVIKN